MNTTAKSLGVIIGRFQVPRLRKGHRSLIEFVRSRSDETLVVLGVPQFPTSRNPLSYELRKAMISRAYPDIHVELLRDHPSDEEWLRNLEALVASRFPTSQVTLYGSRDSFLGMYHGRYATAYAPEIARQSGTQHRQKVAMSAATYEGIRRGIIQTYEKLVPTVHATVDIAPLRFDQNHMQVLLGRKKSEGGKWRFIGGRIDPEDSSAEYAARRELREEAGNFEVADFRYLGSQKINDWRYRGSKDGILTTFFRATYVDGIAQANDDIHELKWFDVDQLTDLLIADHLPLAQRLHESVAAERQSSLQPEIA